VTPSEVPVSASLSARVIRACPTHAQCPLECSERTIEDLGTIANSDNRSVMHKMKESYLKWRASSQMSEKPS